MKKLDVIVQIGTSLVSDLNRNWLRKKSRKCKNQFVYTDTHGGEFWIERFLKPKMKR